jgi:hypothetical protein
MLSPISHIRRRPKLLANNNFLRLMTLCSDRLITGSVRGRNGAARQD